MRVTPGGGLETNPPGSSAAAATNLETVCEDRPAHKHDSRVSSAASRIAAAASSGRHSASIGSGKIKRGQRSSVFKSFGRLNSMKTFFEPESHKEPRSVPKHAFFSHYDIYSGRWATMQKWTIHPDSQFVRYWTAIQMVLILICLIFIPFEMSFDYETKWHGGNNTQRMWTVVMPMMDAYFLADVVVNFLIAFVEDGELVQDRRAIARRYLRGWFLPDIVSSLSSILAAISAQAEVGMLRNVRLLRFVRALKLIRLLKFKQLLDTLDGVRNELLVVAKLAKLLLLTFAIAHMVACGMFLVAKKYPATPDFGGTWVDVYFADPDHEDPSDPQNWRNVKTVEQKYLAALYWAFITTTTVGFGDINPQTDEERMFLIFAAFVGTGIFAYITGEIAALASYKNQRELEIHTRSQDVTAFMQFYQFPRDLRRRVRHFFDANSRSALRMQPKELMTFMSLELRVEIGHHLKQCAVLRSSTLRTVSHKTAFAMALRMHSLAVEAGKVMLYRGEIADAMIILDQGEVDVMRLDTADSGWLKTVYGLREGFTFGFLTPGFTEPDAQGLTEVWCVEVVATVDCQGYYIKRRAFEELCEECDDLTETMEQHVVDTKEADDGNTASLQLAGRVARRGSALPIDPRRASFAGAAAFYGTDPGAGDQVSASVGTSANLSGGATDGLTPAVDGRRIVAPGSSACASLRSSVGAAAAGGGAKHGSAGLTPAIDGRQIVGAGLRRDSFTPSVGGRRLQGKVLRRQSSTELANDACDPKIMVSTMQELQSTIHSLKNDIASLSQKLDDRTAPARSRVVVPPLKLDGNIIGKAAISRHIISEV